MPPMVMELLTRRKWLKKPLRDVRRFINSKVAAAPIREMM